MFRTLFLIVIAVIALVYFDVLKINWGGLNPMGNPFAQNGTPLPAPDGLWQLRLLGEQAVAAVNHEAGLVQQWYAQHRTSGQPVYQVAPQQSNYMNQFQVNTQQAYPAQPQAEYPKIAQQNIPADQSAVNGFKPVDNNRIVFQITQTPSASQDGSGQASLASAVCQKDRFLSFTKVDKTNAATACHDGCEYKRGVNPNMLMDVGWITTGNACTQEGLQQVKK